MSTELGPDSSLRELFEAVQVESGVNVVPLRVSKAEDDIARLAIIVTGDREEANLLVANLMAYVDQMHEAVMQMQRAAEAEDESPIIVS